MPVRNLQPVRRATRRRCILPGHWIHVSARTVHGRHAFENFEPEFKSRAWGIIGIANARYGVLLAAFVLMGNHFHALIQARRPRRISQWNQYVKAGLARLTHEFHGTTGPVWDGPFRHTNALTDAAELHWFRYICAHSVKEGLTNHPAAWPGPNCIDALLEGKPIIGRWLDKDAWRIARRKDRKAPKAAFMREIPVELTPLSIGHRSPQVWLQTCHEVIAGILAEYAQPSLPAMYTPTRDFTHVPETTKKSRAYCFDARTSTGGVDRERLKEAEEARSNAAEASVFGYRRMVELGLPELPDGLQWPALIADAAEEELAEAPFPGRAGPRQSAA